MLKKCTKCGKEFETKRKDARFCNTKCRVAYSRLSVTEDELSVTSVTDNVTDNKTKEWLEEQFRLEGKFEDEQIKEIMINQVRYREKLGYWFIPARMQGSFQSFNG
jgi:predicted  nucleic acid-binding Zn-ribbon protein